MSEVQGIFHSPIYYYLIGLIYFLFGRNPAWVSLFIILTNLSCIPLIFFVGKKIFNEKIGLITAAIFTISFEAISYGLWIANASLGLPFIILTFYFFYKSFRENQKYLPLACLLFALAISFDLIIAMNIIAILILYFIYHKQRPKIKTLIFSFIAFLAPLLSYPIFEIRHSFLMTKSFFAMIGGQDAEFKSIFKYLYVYFEGLAREFANIFLPVHGFFAGVIMVTLLFYLFRQLKKGNISKQPWGFVAVWLFATFPNFLINAQVSNTEYSFIGINAAASLLMAAYLNELFTKKRLKLAILILAVVFLGNLKAWSSYLSNPQKKLFDSQKGVILKDTLAVIDYTYNRSSDQPFFVHTVTVPLYVSKLWGYLYSWHGQEKYGHLPSTDSQTPIQYLIIEQGSGLTFDFFKQKKIDELNLVTKIEEKKQFGPIIVEKRLLSTDSISPSQKSK